MLSREPELLLLNGLDGACHLLDFVHLYLCLLLSLVDRFLDGAKRRRQRVRATENEQEPVTPST